MNQSIVIATGLPLADSLAVQTIEAFCYEGHVDGPEFWFDVTVLDLGDSSLKKTIEEEVCRSVMYLAFRGHLEQHPTRFSKVRFKEHVLAPLKISGQFDWVGIDLARGCTMTTSLTPQSVPAAPDVITALRYTLEFSDVPKAYRGPILDHFTNRLDRLKPQPCAAPEWRLLRNGETIQPGDEGLQDDCVTWLPMVGWEYGMIYNNVALVPMRRRTSSSTPQPETTASISVYDGDRP